MLHLDSSLSMALVLSPPSRKKWAVRYAERVDFQSPLLYTRCVPCRWKKNQKDCVVLLLMACGSRSEASMWMWTWSWHVKVTFKVATKSLHRVDFKVLHTWRVHVRRQAKTDSTADVFVGRCCERSFHFSQSCKWGKTTILENATARNPESWKIFVVDARTTSNMALCIIGLVAALSCQAHFFWI